MFGQCVKRVRYDRPMFLSPHVFSTDCWRSVVCVRVFLDSLSRWAWRVWVISAEAHQAASASSRQVQGPVSRPPAGAYLCLLHYMIVCCAVLYIYIYIYIYIYNVYIYIYIYNICIYIYIYIYAHMMYIYIYIYIYYSGSEYGRSLQRAADPRSHLEVEGILMACGPS